MIIWLFRNFSSNYLLLLALFLLCPHPFLFQAHTKNIDPVPSAVFSNIASLFLHVELGTYI